MAAQTEIALLSAFGNFKWGTLKVDAVKAEHHSHQVTALEHAREKGGPVTDGAVVQLPVVRVSAIITDTPTDEDALPGRSIDTLSQLLVLKDNAEPLDLQTGILFYPDMLLIGVDVSREDSRAGLSPSLTFKKADFISSETVAIPDDELGSGVVAEATSEANAGKVTATEMDGAEDEAVTGSTAYQLIFGG